jgi:hypothetical protein
MISAISAVLSSDVMVPCRRRVTGGSTVCGTDWQELALTIAVEFKGFSARGLVP